MNERIDTKSLSALTGNIHRARYSFANRYVVGKTVLDIACGIGYGSQLLAKAQAKKVIGVDIDPKSIESAQKNYNHPNTQFIVGSGTSIPLADSSIDVVVSFETIEHIKNYHKFLDEICRVLRPSGTLIISTPNRKLSSPVAWMRPGNLYHVREFTRQEFHNLVGNKFEKISEFGQQSIKNNKKLQLIQTSILMQFTCPFKVVLTILKKLFPKLRQYHRNQIRDQFETNNSQIIDVHPVSQINFSRYLVIVANKPTNFKVVADAKAKELVSR